MIYIISYILKSFFVKIFHWKIISFSILCFTQIESLTNNDGYFNARLRPQNSNFRNISTQEQLSPKEISIDKIKTNFIMRNDPLEYLDQEKSLEAAEAVLSGNSKVVRKFKLDFFNFVKINGEKYKFSKPFSSKLWFWDQKNSKSKILWIIVLGSGYGIP